jgi:hypothetical protein
MQKKYALVAVLILLGCGFNYGFHAKALSLSQIVSQGVVLGDSTTFYPYPTGTLVDDSGTVYFISGTTKVPFANWQAFVGLGYQGKNIVAGDLTNYTLAQGFTISSANTTHPWGSWLIYKGTVYYATQEGLIGVPSAAVFTSNGGDWIYIVKANSYDVAALNANPNLPLLTLNDPRVYGSSTYISPITPTSTPYTGQSVAVLSPESGAQWQVGSTQTITWTPPVGDAYVDVNIDLITGIDCTMTDGGGACTADQNIAADVANSGSYSWTVASPNFSVGTGLSSPYKIKVSFPDSAGGMCGNVQCQPLSGTSGVFNITNSTASTPTISSISPDTASVGTQVTITGTGFTPTGNSVFTGSPNAVTPMYVSNLDSANGATLTYSVSILPTNCPAQIYGQPSNCAVANYAGTYQLFVSNANGTSNPVNFTITQSVSTSSTPTITSLTPSSGPTFTQVTINGSGLAANTYSINFGSGQLSGGPGGPLVNAYPPNSNPNSMTFTVPEALNCGSPIANPCNQNFTQFPPGTYQVSVTTPAGTSNSLPFTVTASSTPPVTVLSPTAGEVLAQGSTLTIQWQTAVAGQPADVGLDLLQNGGGILGIGNVPNTGSYTWTVPMGSAYVGSNFQIIVYGNGSAESGMFSIVQTPNTSDIQIISPNGGETYTQGANNYIQWQGESLKEVDVLLTDVNGNRLGYIYSHNMANLASGITNYNATYWTAQEVSSSPYYSTPPIPISPGSYKILIINQATGVSDISASPFTVVSGSPSISVQMPSQGAQLTAGQTYNVTWTSNGVQTVNVKICFTSNTLGYICESLNGLSANISASTGSFSWYVDPNSLWFPGSDFKIRVTDNTSGIYGESGIFSVGN